MSNRIAAIARTTATHVKPVALPLPFAVLMWASAAAGAVPVFAGGMATASLVSPSGGFLIGFLPGVVVTALLKGAAQSVMTGVPFVAVALASAGFIIGDLVKAAVAALASAGISRL